MKTLAELQIVLDIHLPYRHHHFQTLDPTISILQMQGASSLRDTFLNFHILICLFTDLLD